MDEFFRQTIAQIKEELTKKLENNNEENEDEDIGDFSDVEEDEYDEDDDEFEEDEDDVENQRFVEPQSESKMFSTPQSNRAGIWFTFISDSFMIQIHMGLTHDSHSYRIYIGFI